MIVSRELLKISTDAGRVGAVASEGGPRHEVSVDVAVVAEPLPSSGRGAGG